MNARQQVDEMTSYLQLLHEYAHGPGFDREQKLAVEEFYGRSDREALEQARQDPSYAGWYLFDRHLSAREVTPVRQFVTDHPNLPDRIRGNLLNCEQAVVSVFWLAEVTPEAWVVLDLHGDRGDYYRVIPTDGVAPEAGSMVSGRLVRWDDQHHFLGRLRPWPQTAGDIVGWRRRAWSEGDRLPVTRPRATDFGTRGDWLRTRRQRP